MTRRWVVLAVAAALASLLAPACSGGSTDDAAVPATASSTPIDTTPPDCGATEPEALRPTVRRTIPHDPMSYTQGLVEHDGVLFESAGLYGESRLRTIDPETGDELDSVSLADRVFAEGLAVGEDGELVQLTWKDGVAYRWSSDDLAKLGEFAYEGEGWGLTTIDDGTLVMSNGSDVLTVRDPGDFSVLATHRVTRDGGPTDELNELEWDGTSIWANRYQTDELLRIDPVCWTVTGVVDMAGLRRDAAAAAQRDGTRIDVTNGIARIPGSDRFFVTGKWWPTMYEVSFEPVA